MTEIPKTNTEDHLDQSIDVENFKLEKLRWFRGNDDAVEKIEGPQEEKLLSVLRGPKEKSRDDLMTAIFENYSGKAYGDHQWRKVTGGWTTPEVPTIYGDFRSTYEGLSQLSLDPGFITHLPEFMEMQDSLPDNSGYQDARESLKNKLGDKTVWRGMMLTEEEMEDVKQYGIMSPFTGYVSESKTPKEEFEAKILSTYISESIERHFHGENHASPFLSVSSHRDLAISVGRHFGKKGEGRKFYLFKIKVPEVDLISYTDVGVRKPSKLQDSTSKLSIAVDGEENKYEWDKEAESFVFWKIDPEEIVEITQPKVKESSWNNRKTIGA